MVHLTSIRSRLLAATAFVLMATGAQAADWKLVELSGQVRIAAPGSDAAAGRLNQTLPIGSSVTTLQGGRAVLDNGLQHIVVGPNSRMTLAPEQTSGMARVVQDLGAILFQVDKKPNPHFRVETPLLAAVVKGTTFTVEVDALADTVNVAEGLVEVRSNGNNLGRDVPAGASGAVLRDAPMSVQLMTLTTDAAPVLGPEPVSAAIPALDYKAASDGLIAGAAPAIMANGPPQAGAALASSDPSPASALAEQPAVALQAGSGQAAGGGSQINILAAQVSGTETATALLASAGNGNGGQGFASLPGGGVTIANGNSGNGNGNSGNGNGGGNIVTAVVDPLTGAAGNSGHGGGNGNGNNGNGGGNGGSNIVTAVVDPLTGLADNPTGNSGHGGGNGNGNNGNGNGNGGSNIVTAVVDPLTGVVGGIIGNSGNGGGNGNGNNGNGGGNGNSGNGGENGGGNNGNGGGNGNSGNGGGNNGNGNGNGGANIVTAVVDPVVGAVGGLLGGGNNGNGNGNGNNGNGNGNGGSSLAGLLKSKK